MILPLAAVLCAAWPAPHARVHVTTSGKFEAAPSERLSPEVLDALNAALAASADTAVEALQLEPVHGEKDLAKLRKAAKPLAAGEGDRSFVLEVAIAGTRVSAAVRSLHRAADIAGGGEAAVPFAHDAAGAQVALGGALLTAISTAFSDLREHLADDQSRPRVHVKLLLATANLGEKQREAAEGLLRCAAGLAEPLAVQPTDGGDGVLAAELELRLKRYDPDETVEQLVKGYAGRLHLELGRDGQARCSTARTPLQGLDPVVTTTRAEVHVRFERPEP